MRNRKPESSLFSIYQDFEVFHGTLRDGFSSYARESGKHANTPPDYLLLSLIGKDFRFPAFMIEWK